ncbi:hypothetical protein R3P38DRAFT_3170694 [Favolaschia claudopus]|uniref:Uncharacterized protein n=1 Tax=Favolaschia claudopus TaxID=2862362 RepID=A0AAW0DUC7_9AGAR
MTAIFVALSAKELVSALIFRRSGLATHLSSHRLRTEDIDGADASLRPLLQPPPLTHAQYALHVHMAAPHCRYSSYFRLTCSSETPFTHCSTAAAAPLPHPSTSDTASPGL